MTDATPLPQGWSVRYTPDGKPFYQNDTIKTTQWHHPTIGTNHTQQNAAKNVELKVKNEKNTDQKLDSSHMHAGKSETHSQNRAVIVAVELETENEKNNDQTSTDSSKEIKFKNPRVMIALYAIFCSLLLIAAFVQFVAKVEAKVMFWMQITGGCCLIASIIYQFGFSLKDMWTRRALYLPLLYHIFDTASDFGTSYIYYESIDYDNSYLQLFLSSLLVIFVYRIISSILVFVRTKQWKSALLQFFDLYIYQILIKSWELNKTDASKTQKYIASLEAYLEAYPQIILGSTAVMTELSKNDVNEFNYFILFSALLSLTSVSMAAVAEDLTYFRADSSIRRKKYCGLFYFNHILYRYCDVFLRSFVLMCVWMMFNGFVVVSVLGFDFLGAIISASAETKSINFEMLSCMAATPLITKRLRGASLLGICRKWFEIMVMLYVAYFALLGGSAGSIVSTFGFVVWIIVLLAFIYVNTMSFMYYMEVSNATKGNGGKCCNVMREYGSKSNSFEGIECGKDLIELFQFGYVIKSSDISKGDFTTMYDILNVYNIVMNNI
eukprot:86924_1